MIPLKLILFPLSTIILCNLHCFWLIKANKSVSPDYTNFTRQKWPLYISSLVWFFFLSIDCNSAQNFFINCINRPIQGTLWAMILGIGITILHLHTGMFLVDTSSTLKISQFRNKKKIQSFIGHEVTLLIPACNEPVSILRATLTAAKNQKYNPKNVVLVENSSDPKIKLKALSLVDEIGIKMDNVGSGLRAIPWRRWRIHPAQHQMGIVFSWRSRLLSHKLHILWL